VEDPNVVGGGWANPGAAGPFQYSRVIPGVANTVFKLSTVRPTDSGIALARVDIPGGPGLETQTITDVMIKECRSIADLSGERVAVDKIATAIYADHKRPTSNSVLPGNNSAFITFPSEAVWQVPVPAWATGVDVLCDVNPNTSGHIWGEARMLIAGVAGAATEFDENGTSSGGGYRALVRAGGTQPIPLSARGQVTEFRLQCKQRAGQGFTLTDLVANLGTFLTFMLVFQRYPNYS